MPTNFINPFASNKLQPLPAAPELPKPVTARHRRGRARKYYPATQTPTYGDIRQAAGFYSGEGHVTYKLGHHIVVIGQNDREELDWIRDMFGGIVYGPVQIKSGNEHYVLRMVREHALGFMFTIFTFLKRSRRNQFKAALIGKPQKRIFRKIISDDGIISEAYFMRHYNKAIKRLEKKQEQERKRIGAMGIFGVKR